MQIKNLLVPVDFSPPSILAVNYGVALARKLRCRLTMLHVGGIRSDWDQNHTWFALQALIGPEDQDDLNVEALVKEGDVESQIAAAISETKADAVVMGTHGRRLLGRLLIGSVTQDLLRKTPVPIFTVCQVSRPLGFGNILYATDLSDASMRGFREIVQLARTLGSSLQIMHVLTPPLSLYPNPESVTLQEADQRRYRRDSREKLDRMAASIKKEKIACETILIEGNAASEILKVADERMVDLIAMAVEDRGFRDRTVFGTTAERVMRESRIPVISLNVSAKTGFGNWEEISMVL